MESGKPEKAEPLFRQAIAGMEKNLGTNDVNVGNERISLGFALFKLKHYTDAERELLAAERILSASADAPAAMRRRLYQKFVDLYEAWDKAEPGKGFDAKAQPWRAKVPVAAPAVAEGQSPSPDQSPAAAPATATAPPSTTTPASATAPAPALLLPSKAAMRGN